MGDRELEATPKVSNFEGGHHSELHGSPGPGIDSWDSTIDLTRPSSLVPPFVPTASQNSLKCLISIFKMS